MSGPDMKTAHDAAPAPAASGSPSACLTCLVRRESGWLGRAVSGSVVLGLLVATHALTFLAARRSDSPPPPPVARVVTVSVERPVVTEAEALRRQLDDVNRRRDLEETRVGLLTQAKTAREQEISDLRLAYAEDRKALKVKERALAMLDECSVNLLSLVAGPPVPAIDTKVEAVKSDVQPQLVLLSAGSDDKVEKGFHFSIYRGSEFVGKVIVEKVLKDSCGCRVLFTKEGLSIERGDLAATRLQ